MIRKEDGGSTSGGRDWANVKVNTPRRRRRDRGPDSRSVIKGLLHTVSYENSDEIALAIYRDITETLSCHRENEEYVERIRRELFLLCNYNRALTKAEGRFPRMLSLKNVLARYVELEYVVLYSRTHEGAKRNEREVEKRVRSILYMMLSNVHQQPVDHKLLHKSVLFVLQQVGTRYWAEERIVHRLNVHVFQKYGKFDAIVKIKDSREEFLIEHLRNNDPDIAYLSVDPFEDVKDFEQNVFIKIPEVSANKISSLRPSAFIKTEKVKIEKVKSAQDEDVKQCGVILTIDLTSEAQTCEDKTTCSTGKQQSISDKCREPDLSNKDLSNSSVQTVEEIAVVKSTNDSSASCRQNNDVIVISDGDVPGDDEEESVSVPNAKANVIDLTSDGEQEVQECVAQDKTSEDPVPAPALIFPPSPPRVPSPENAPVNRVDEICDNNEPAPIIQHMCMRSVTVNQVNEVSSSVISESDEVSRNEEVPANDGNVSSTGNSPSRNSVPYSNGEISSTTGKLDENALIELIYRKQSDLVDNCNFENSPSQSGTVYSKKCETEKECGISSPTNNLDLIESARVQNNDEVGKQHDEVPIINIDDTEEESTNDPCSSKQLQTASAQSDVSKNENERVAASCHQNETGKREEHISRSLAEKESNHRNVHSTELAEHALLLITTEALTEQIEKKQQNRESYRNLHSIKSAEDTSNSPLLLAKSKTSEEEAQEQRHSCPNYVLDRNAKHLNVKNSLTNEFTNNQKSTSATEGRLEKAEDAQIRDSGAIDVTMNHSECNSEANEDISLILEALINASTDEKVIETKNIESRPLNKATRVIFKEIDDRIFSDVIINEYDELVNRINEYEKQIVNHGIESIQNDDELEAARNQLQFENDDGDSLLTENSNYQNESNELQMEPSLMQGIEQSDAFVTDHRQLDSEPDDILDSSSAEICMSGEPIAEKQVEENLELNLLAENIVNIECDDQIEEENVLAENTHVEDKQSEVQALISTENERVSDRPPTLQKNLTDAEKGDAAINQLHVTNNDNEFDLRNSLSDDLQPARDQVVKENRLAPDQEKIVGELVAEHTCNASQTDEFDQGELLSESEQFKPHQVLKKDQLQEEEVVCESITEHTSSKTDQFNLGDLPNENDTQFKPPNQVLKGDQLEEEKIVRELVSEHTCNASQTDEFDLGDLPSENEPFEPRLPPNQVLKKDQFQGEEAVCESITELMSKTDEFNLGDLPNENDAQFKQPNHVLNGDQLEEEKTVRELVSEHTCNASQTDEFDLGDFPSENEQFEPRLTPNQVLKKDQLQGEEVVCETVTEHTSRKTDQFNLGDLPNENDAQLKPPNQVLKGDQLEEEKIVRELVSEHTCDASQTDEFDLGNFPNENEQFQLASQVLKKDQLQREEVVCESITDLASKTDEFNLGDLPSKNDTQFTPSNQVLKADRLEEEKIVQESIPKQTCNANKIEKFDLGDSPNKRERYKPRLPKKQNDTNLKKKIDSVDLKPSNLNKCNIESKFKLSDDQSCSEPSREFDEPSFTTRNKKRRENSPPEKAKPHINNEPVGGALANPNNFQPGHWNSELTDSCESAIDDFLCGGSCPAGKSKFQDNSKEVEQNICRDNIVESTLVFNPDTVALSINKENTENCHVIEKNVNASSTMKCEARFISDEKIPESVCDSPTAKECSHEPSVTVDIQEKGEPVLIEPTEINDSTPSVNEPPIKIVQTNLDSICISSNSNLGMEINISGEPPVNSMHMSLASSDSAANTNLETTETNGDAINNDSPLTESMQTILSSPVLTNASFSESADVEISLDSSILTNNENFKKIEKVETNESNTLIKNVQTKADPSVVTVENLTTESKDCDTPIKNVQTKTDPTVLTDENSTTEIGDSHKPIKKLQLKPDPSVLTNENLATEIIDNDTPINNLQTKPYPSVLTNENLGTEIIDNDTPINNLQTKPDPSVLTNENLATEIIDDDTPINHLQIKPDPSVLTSENLTTDINESNPPIKNVQANLDPTVLTNENLMTETNVVDIPTKTVQANLGASVLTTGNLPTEASVSKPPIKTVQKPIVKECNSQNQNESSMLDDVQEKEESKIIKPIEINESTTAIDKPPIRTSLDSSISSNSNFAKETNEDAYISGEPPTNSGQMSLDSVISAVNRNLETTETIEDNNQPMKSVPASLNSPALTNTSVEMETSDVKANLDPSILTNEVTNIIGTPIKTVQTNLEPSVLTNENLTSEINISNTPIETVPNNLEPSVLTNENLKSETNVSNVPIETVQTNLASSVCTVEHSTAETNELPIQTVSTNKKLEAETNENADLTEGPQIKNSAASDNFGVQVKPDPFMIDEKQAANVLECYKNSRNFFLMGQPDDLLYTSNEEVVSEEAPKAKSVPSELSVLIYNPDVNKNPLNLLATAAGTRPNLEVSPSKKLERSRVKMGGGGKPCNKGGKRQRSPKAAPNMKTRTTPPRAAKNNVTLNYCDKNKRFSIRSWVERNMRYNKTNEVVQQQQQEQPPQASTYNSDYNVTNDESSDSFDGLIIAEDVEPPETENPIDILDENTVDNELVLVRSESAVQISIPETEEYDHQILEDLEKIEAQKELAVCKNLFGYDPSNQHLLNINEEDVPKKTKTTDHSIQSILNISPTRSKSNLDFTLYNTESDSALDLSVGKCVSYEEPKANLVPYMFTDDGEILSLKSIKQGVFEYNAESGARTPTKTKAEVKEYHPFVCLSRHEVADYISSQTVPAQTTRKKNLRSHAKFKNFKSRKRMSKESKRGRKGKGVKKTKELLSRQILEDEIKDIVIADKKCENKVSKSAKQKEPKPSKRERANSFKSQAEDEELQKATTTTDSDRKGKVLTITDSLMGKDVRRKGEKERNKKTKSNRSNELNCMADDKQEKNLITPPMNEIEMTLRSKENTEKHNQEIDEEPELKLKKKNEIVRITERRRTMESSRGNEQQDEVKKLKNETGKNTRSTERRKSVEVKRKEQQENQLETKPKKKESEPENDGAFAETEAAVKSKKSETTKCVRKSVETRRRSEPEVRHNRSEIVKREKLMKGIEKDESAEADQNKNKNLEKLKMPGDQEENRPQISKAEKYKKRESSEGERTALEKKIEKLEIRCKIKHKTENNKQEDKGPRKLKTIEAERKKEEAKSSKEAETLKTKPPRKNSRTEKEAFTAVNELEKKPRANKESEPEKSELPSKKASEMFEVKPKKNKIVKNSTKRNEPEKKSEPEKHKMVKNREDEKDGVISKKETDKPKKNSNKRNEQKFTALLEPEKKSTERRKTEESVENEQRKGEWDLKSKSKTESYTKSSKGNEQVKDTEKLEKKSEIIKLKAVKKSKENEQVASVKETENVKTRSRKNEVIKNRESNEQESEVHSVNETEQKEDKICTKNQKTEESEEIEQENEKLKRKESEIIENIEKQKSEENTEIEICQLLKNAENEPNKIPALVNEMQQSNEVESLQKIISTEEEIEKLQNIQDIASIKNTMQTKNCEEENKIEIEEKLPTSNLSDTEIVGRKINADLQDECKQEIKTTEDDKTESKSETCDLIKPTELSNVKEVESEEVAKTPDFETGENRKSVLDSTEDKHPSEKTENRETVSVMHNEVTDCSFEENEDTKGNQNKENDFIVVTLQENTDTEKLIQTKNSVHLTQTPPEREGIPRASSSNEIVDTETPVGGKRKLPAEPMSETPKKPKLSIEKLKQSLGDKLRVAETERKDAKPKQSKHKFCKIEEIISNLKNKEAHKNESPQKATPAEVVHDTNSDGAAATDENYETPQINPPGSAVVIPKSQTNHKLLLNGVVTTLREEDKSEIDLKQKEKEDLADNTVAKQDGNVSLHTATSFNELSLDGAVNLDSETTETSAIDSATNQAGVDALNVNQKSPHHSPSHTVADDLKYFSKVPLDGSVNLDSESTETSAVSIETEQQADGIDVLSFNQKSPGHSPSHTVAGDVKSFSEITLDVAVGLPPTTAETPAIDAVTKQADVDVLSYNHKSPRHSVSHTVAGDVKSLNEVHLDGTAYLDPTTTKTCAIVAMTKQHTVVDEVKSFNDVLLDGAVCLAPNTTKTCEIDVVTNQTDDNDLNSNQKLPRLSPSDTVVSDITSYNEAPIEDVVNMDATTIEASVNALSFHQKSPRHSPSRACVADDAKLLNEVPLDGALDLDSTTPETSAIDAVVQQNFNQKSPRRSPSHTVAGDVESFEELPLDGAVNLDLTPTETSSAIDDVLIKRSFNHKSPCHSPSYTGADDEVSFSEVPLDGVESLDSNTPIDPVTKHADVSMKCFNQKSPCHSPFQIVEGDRVSSNAAPGDGALNFDDDIMETSAIDAGIKEDDHMTVSLKKQKLPDDSPLRMPLDGAASLRDNATETSLIDPGVKQDDHFAVCLKQKLPGQSPLHVFASGTNEIPLGGAANLDGNAMETSAIDHEIKQDDHNVICLNQTPLSYPHADGVESFDERPLDGAVNLDAHIIEATKQDDHNIMSLRQGSPCHSPLHAAANDIESLDELPLDGAGANVIETFAEVDRNIRVESMNDRNEQEIAVTNRMSVGEPTLDGIAKQRNALSSRDVLQPDVIHTDSVLDAVVSTEEGNECLKENLPHELPMDGDSVVERQHRKPSLDGTASEEQENDGVSHLVNEEEDGASVYSAFSTEQRFYPEEGSPICALKQNEKGDLHHPREQMLDGALTVEEKDTSDIVYYQPKENSFHKPVVDAEQNSNESLYEPLVDGASVYPLEPQVEVSVTQTELPPTERAGSPTEQKMEKILNHNGVFPEEGLPKTMEEKLEFSFAVGEQGTETSLEDKLQPEKADGVENQEPTEVKKIAVASNEAMDIDSCYKALRDVLLDNNQKNLRAANSYLESCPKQHDDFTEPPKLMVAENVLDITSTDEVKVKEPLDCKVKQKDSTFSLYTQEEINDNSIVNPPSVYVQAKKLDGKIIPPSSNSATQRITSIYTQEEINGCTTHPKKADSLNPLGHKKMLLPLPNVNSLIDSAKGMFVKTSTKQPPDFAYSNDFIDLPPSNLEKEIKRDFLYSSEKTPSDKNLGFFDRNKSNENIDNICVESLNFLPHNMLHTDPIPMWRLGEVINENVDILTANSSSQQLKSGVEFDSAIQEERSASEGIWGGEQEKQNCNDKVQGSHLQGFDNPIQEEGVAGNGIDVDEIPSRKTLNPSGTIHIILEPSEHNYCLGGPLLNAKPENNVLKQVDTESLSKMKGNEQVSDGSPVDGEHIFHFSEQISSMVKNNLPTLSMEDSPVDENNDDQDEQKIFSLIENSNTFNFSQPTVMSVQKMNDVMMAIANLNSLTSAQNKKLDKQKADFLFQQEDSISSNDSTVSNDVHSDCDFAINSIAMLRTQNITSDSADDSDFPPHATDIFTSSPASMNVIVKHNQSDFASIDSIFSGNDFDIIAQSKTMAETNAQSQLNTTDVPVIQPVVDGEALKKRKPERDAKHKADVVNAKPPSDAKLSSIQSNILDDMLVKAMQRQNTRTRVLAAQKKVHKEKSEATSSRTSEVASQCQEKIHKEKSEEISSRTIEAVAQCQEEKIHKEKNKIVTTPSAIETTGQYQENIYKEKEEVAITSKTMEVQEQKPEVTSEINGATKTTTGPSPPITILNKTLTNYPPLLVRRQDTPPKSSPSENKDDQQPPVLTPEIQLIKFRPYEDSPGKTQYEDVKMKISRGDELALLQRPREDMIDSIKRRQRRPPEKYVDSVLLKVEKETQEEKFKVFEKNKIKSALASLVKAKEKKPRKRPAEDESSNDSSKSVKLRAKLIECSDYDENTSSDDFYRNKRKKMLKASELSDSSASDTDLEIKIRKERRMTSEERDALFFKVRDGKDCEDQKKMKSQQDTGAQKQVRFNLQQPSTENKQKKTNVQAKPEQDSGGQKQVRFNLQQPVCPSTETKSEKYKQYKNPDAPVKGCYTSSCGGQQHFRTRPDYRDRHTRVPNGGSQSSRCPSYPSQSSEQIYRSRSRSPLIKFGNSSERKSGFQDYRVYTNSQGVPYRNSRSHPGARNVDLPTLLSHYSQIHRASNSSTEWSKNVSGIGTPLPNVSFQAPPNTSKDSSKRT